MADNTALDVDFVRRQFPNLGNGWAYFENAGGSYLPRSVIERMTAFMTGSQVLPGTLNPLSQLSEERLEVSRKLVAEMIGAAPGEFVEAHGRDRIAAGCHHFYALRCLEGVGLDPEEGVLRVSMVHYSTASEVDRLTAALDDLI